MSSHLHLHLSSCIFIVLISVKASLSEITISSTRCDGSSFDKGSPFDDILNQTLLCLETAPTQNNSRYCVRGIIHKVYGFSQCRGDVNSSECYNCLRGAGEKAAEDCNGKREARVYDDKCVLFYQGSVFSDVGFLEPIKGPECSKEKSEDPARFAAGVGSLIRDMSEEAEGKEGFAVRSAWVDGFGREVFGIAQCWSVVAGESCRSCLSRATDTLSGICSASIEGVVAYDCCYLRYQSYPFNSSKIGISSLPPQNSPQPSEAPSELDVRGNSSRNSPALYFFLGGLILAVIVMVLLIVWWKFIKPARLKKMASEKNRPVDYFFSGNLRTISYYDYRTLRKATDNFNPGNKLGKGGFGPVYQGILDDGRMVAVKKLALDKSQQGEPEFLTEVRLITSIQHKNLVRLLGCCSDGPQRLLVYEYMKNRSLDLIVYGKIEQYLDWQTRFQIILGIARGLQYLHEDSHLRIVHRDIKASNILLDDKFQPRIGDFGLARFFPEDQAYLSTTFAGTLGYTAPEYAIRGELSEKADIYSFGVLVLEIISCRKNTDLTLPSEMQYLPEYAWRLYEKSSVVDLVDPKLQADEFVKNDILPVFKVAFLCLQPHPSLRPPMSEVVAMLTRKSEMIPSPIKPTFLDRKPMKDHNLSWETISVTFPSPLPSDSPTVSRHEKPCLH